MAHTAYYVNGKRVPSVTTILGRFKDPGALMYWANKVALDVVIEAVDVLQQGSTTKVSQFLRSKPIERANFRNESAKAMEAGTIAHTLVEIWIHADDVTRSNLSREKIADIQSGYRCSFEQAKQAYNAFHAFLVWIEMNNFVLSETEVKLLSSQYLYGGTIDCIGYLHPNVNELVILDWKTSKALYTDYLLQLAAYGQLWNENWDPPITGYHLLRFDKVTADFQHLYLKDLSLELQMFLHFRAAYELDKQISKRVK